MSQSIATDYTKAYFERGRVGSARSASKVVPELIRLLSPISVVDVGCGIGTWARAFQLHGIDDVLGIDGQYVPKDILQIEEARFLVAELSERLNINRTFDLALTVEVAEHLPPSRAKTFVADLVRLAPAVAFSAAIPGQGGTNHVNEQWPDYWVTYFAEFNYLAVDCLRPQFWDDKEIEFWYRQNLILFIERTQLHRYPNLANQQFPPMVLRIVHPELHIRNLAMLLEALRSSGLSNE
jgi:SAM-dependent methyltransferase